MKVFVPPHGIAFLDAIKRMHREAFDEQFAAYDAPAHHAWLAQVNPDLRIDREVRNGLRVEVGYPLTEGQWKRHNEVSAAFKSQEAANALQREGLVERLRGTLYEGAPPVWMISAPVSEHAPQGVREVMVPPKYWADEKFFVSALATGRGSIWDQFQFSGALFIRRRDLTILLSVYRIHLVGTHAEAIPPWPKDSEDPVDEAIGSRKTGLATVVGDIADNNLPPKQRAVLLILRDLFPTGCCPGGMTPKELHASVVRKWSGTREPDTKTVSTVARAQGYLPAARPRSRSGVER